MKHFLSLAALVGLILVVLGSGVLATDSAVKAESGSAAPAVAVSSATAANVSSGAAGGAIAEAKAFQEQVAAAKILPERPAALLIQTALDNKNRLEFTDDQVKLLTVLLAVAKDSAPQSAVPAVVFPEGTPPAEAKKLAAENRENLLRVDLMKILQGIQAKHLAGLVNKLPPAGSATAPQSAAPASK